MEKPELSTNLLNPTGVPAPVLIVFSYGSCTSPWPLELQAMYSMRYFKTIGKLKYKGPYQPQKLDNFRN